MTTTMKGQKAEIGRAVESTGLDRIETGISQAAIGLLMSMAGLVGVWGLACLISGIAKSGGIIELARNWLVAIGM